VDDDGLGADLGCGLPRAWLPPVFYALAGAGGTAVPPLAELRVRVASLLASLCDDDAGAA